MTNIVSDRESTLSTGRAASDCVGLCRRRKIRLAMPPEHHSNYTRLLRPLMFRLDPETAHRLTIAALSLMPPKQPASDPPELATMVFGIKFANPIGLAAGLDKDARAIRAWNALGFGFAELGTITPRRQPGNAPPRMWRLPAHRALINRLGFPGEGMEVGAARLARLPKDQLAMRLALNFGPNKDTPPECVAEDYAALTRRLVHFADFIVVNLSSPNTPGLREWQAPEWMRAIVEAVRAAIPPEVPAMPSTTRAESPAMTPANPPHPPILVKIAPDLDSSQINEVCRAAVDLAIDGIVATNTTLMREEVGVSATFAGGLSGPPLLARSREVIAQVYRETSGRMPIIGVGGIANAEDAYGHLCAGASLVEFYTGMIYRGPGLAREIKRGLVRLLARDGFRSISEAVGSAARK
jgi:dihydroorotate dehydrogenase